MRKLLLISFLLSATTLTACADGSIPVNIPVPKQHIKITGQQICDKIPDATIRSQVCDGGTGLAKQIVLNNLKDLSDEVGFTSPDVDFRENFKNLPEIAKSAYYAVDSVTVSGKIFPNQNSIGISTPAVTIKIADAKSNGKQDKSVEFATIPPIEAGSRDTIDIESADGAKEAGEILKKMYFKVEPALPDSLTIPAGSKIDPNGVFDAEIKPEITVYIDVSNVFKQGFMKLQELAESIGS